MDAAALTIALLSLAISVSIGVRMIVQSRPRPHVIDPHDDPDQAISRFDRMDGVDIFRGGPREDER